MLSLRDVIDFVQMSDEEGDSAKDRCVPKMVEALNRDGRYDPSQDRSPMVVPGVRRTTPPSSLEQAHADHLAKLEEDILATVEHLYMERGPVSI